MVNLERRIKNQGVLASFALNRTLQEKGFEKYRPARNQVLGILKQVSRNMVLDGASDDQTSMVVRNLAKILPTYGNVDSIQSAAQLYFDALMQINHEDYGRFLGKEANYVRAAPGIHNCPMGIIDRALKYGKRESGIDIFTKIIDSDTADALDEVKEYEEAAA